MKILTDKNFLIGVAFTFAVLKWGDKIPVIGPTVAKIKV
jgi:hypothetical protein